jgi:hypothetical protein
LPYRHVSTNYLEDTAPSWIHQKKGIVFYDQIQISSTNLSQVTRSAIERDERDRAQFKMLVGEHFQPEHLVFADESHFNRHSLRRDYAWSPRGSRARRRDFFIRGKRYGLPFLIGNSSLIVDRYSILPAISLDGVIHLEVIDRSFTGHEFTNFVRGVLDQMQPWPLPNSVLVMDNARIHKVPGIREMIEER